MVKGGFVEAGPDWCHCCNRSKPKLCIKSVAATVRVQIYAVCRETKPRVQTLRASRSETTVDFIFPNQRMISPHLILVDRAGTEWYKLPSLIAENRAESALLTAVATSSCLWVWPRVYRVTTVESPFHGESRIWWRGIYASMSVHLTYSDVIWSGVRSSSEHCGVSFRATLFPCSLFLIPDTQSIRVHS